MKIRNLVFALLLAIMPLAIGHAPAPSPQSYLEHAWENSAPQEEMRSLEDLNAVIREAPHTAFGRRS